MERAGTTSTSRASCERLSDAKPGSFPPFRLFLARPVLSIRPCLSFVYLAGNRIEARSCTEWRFRALLCAFSLISVGKHRVCCLQNVRGEHPLHHLLAAQASECCVKFCSAFAPRREQFVVFWKDVNPFAFLQDGQILLTKLCALTVPQRLCLEELNDVLPSERQQL